ncbi:MAG: site-specific integrase [wastewater metagenome]|nr:site-specific integrase [Candidatus Loosdrechtia aerotolerans]
MISLNTVVQAQLATGQERRLLENTPQWLRDIIFFDLHTGLCQGELLSLQWDRVDLFRKIIIIQESKSGKQRTIPLNQIALNILMEKAKIRNLKNDIVFLSNAITKIDRHNPRMAFNNAIKKAGIHDFHFHDPRHTFATRLAQRSIDIYKILKLLGHHSVEMTQRYAHHCLDSLKNGVEALEFGHNLAQWRKTKMYRMPETLEYIGRGGGI